MGFSCDNLKNSEGVTWHPWHPSNEAYAIFISNKYLSWKSHWNKCKANAKVICMKQLIFHALWKPHECTIRDIIVFEYWMCVIEENALLVILLAVYNIFSITFCFLYLQSFAIAFLQSFSIPILQSFAIAFFAIIFNHLM